MLVDIIFNIKNTLKDSEYSDLVDLAKYRTTNGGAFKLIKVALIIITFKNKTKKQITMIKKTR